MSHPPLIEKLIINDLDEADEFLEDQNLSQDEVEAIVMESKDFGGFYAIISLIEDGEELAETCTFDTQSELKEFLLAAFGMDIPMRMDRL